MSSYRVATLVILWICVSGIDCRQLNITNLENCQELAQDAVVVLKTISYHVVPETGVCDTVHGEMEVKSPDYKPRIITITLYKCADSQSTEACLENPTQYEETLGCDRLTNADDSGPWAMFSAGIGRSNCGQSTGVFSVDYSTLNLDKLINYFDLHDEFGRFRLRMHFLSTQTNSLRACVDLDFKLLM